MKSWNTELWKKRRVEILKTRNKCELCGSTERLNVHHIFPRNRMAYEFLIDFEVLVLCWNCHSSIHKYIKLVENQELKRYKLVTDFYINCIKKKRSNNITSQK